MKQGLILVGVLCLFALASLLACPYDFHGSHTCSSAAQAGRTIAFYLFAPGLWLGSVISGVVSTDPHAGASVPAYIVGTLLWLAVLAGAARYLGRLTARSGRR